MTGWHSGEGPNGGGCERVEAMVSPGRPPTVRKRKCGRQGWPQLTIEVSFIAPGTLSTAVSLGCPGTASSDSG
jgi:hypothetical protein